MAVDINKILDEARALGCSDLHFTVGIPPILRQGGNLRKLSSCPDMTEIEIQNITKDMCNDKQRQQIKDHIDTDFSIDRKDIVRSIKIHFCYHHNRLDVLVLCYGDEFIKK